MRQLQRSLPLPSMTHPITYRLWTWLLLGVLLVVMGIGIGWALRPALPGAGSPDVTFARDMAMHHEQATEMALILYQRSTDDALRTLALDIILTQRTQVGQMQGWLAVWNQPLVGLEPTMAGHGEMMGMATPEQVESLRSLPVSEAEVVLLQLMIRHHQGGVMMAEDALAQTQRPEVRRLATSIVNSQQTEIAYMERLLTERDAVPLAPLPPMPDTHGAHG